MVGRPFEVDSLKPYDPGKAIRLAVFVFVCVLLLSGAVCYDPSSGLSSKRFVENALILDVCICAVIGLASMSIGMAGSLAPGHKELWRWLLGFGAALACVTMLGSLLAVAIHHTIE